MNFILQVPSVQNEEALGVLKELSPWAYVVTALALSIATLFIYLYIKEKGLHEETKNEYLKYAKETVAEQISVSNDVIDLVKNSTGKLSDKSIESRKVLDHISNSMSAISNQLQRIESLITK